jgi:ribosomal protein L12E/L44/L45/RPP1/RPP2
LISAKVPKTAEELHFMYNPLPVYLNLQPDHVTESGVKIENILTVIAESLEEYKQSNSRSPVEVGKSVETILEIATTATASAPATSPSASFPSQDTLQPQERQQRKIEEERREEKDPPEDTSRGEIMLGNVEVNIEHIEEVEDSLQTAAESRDEIRKALPVSAIPTPLPFSVALVSQRSRWLRIAGALVAAGALSYFVGIGPPSFPLLGTFFPSFFSWTLRWRTNMNRL